MSLGNVSGQGARLSIPPPLACWLQRWKLIADGHPLITENAFLLPVLSSGYAAMLKVARIEEERRGAEQLAWWSGAGAARVYAVESDALLMERACGGSLVALAHGERDMEATTVICRVAERLHATRPPFPGFLQPLHRWFEPLFGAVSNGSDLAHAGDVARRLLASTEEPLPLHGDLHHENILDFGDGDWRAIDPKGLIGDRTSDLIHLLRNPDRPIAQARLEHRTAQVSAEARVDRRRLLEWLVAYSGLSAAWLILEGGSPAADLELLRQGETLIRDSQS